MLCCVQVTFNVMTDLDTERDHAGKIEFLPKGTVVFEAILEEELVEEDDYDDL